MSIGGHRADEKMVTLTCAQGHENPRALPYDMKLLDWCSTCGQVFGDGQRDPPRYMPACALADPNGPQAADTIERLEASQDVILGEGQARIEWITAEQDLLESYADEYVLSTEGADYEPTEFERELIRDALQGFVIDHDRLLCQHLRKANLTKEGS